MKLKTCFRGSATALLASLGWLTFAACDGGVTVECDESTPVSNSDGLEQCGNGLVHRPRTATCESSLPRAGETCNDGAIGDCSMDADCTAQAHGYCSSFQICGCSYGCLTDADCGAGRVCVCGEPVGTCQTAACATDGDCGEGSLCAQYTECFTKAFACTTDDDACLVDADCPANNTCGFDTTLGYRTCSDTSDCPVPGRPFLVDGVMRLAPRADRDDWSAPGNAASAVRSDAPWSIEAAEHWTDIALMEHASIGAFARFALQLLEVGAPLEFVLEAQRALEDETRHARTAFGLASQFAGEPIGPGSLRREGALRQSDLLSIVRLTVREGCIGETLAAMEAAEAAAHCSDAGLQGVLGTIAADEQRHAALAWRFVAWAMKQHGQAVADVVREELALAERSVAIESSNALTERELQLAEVGVLPRHMREQVHAHACRHVVMPCLQALLARPSATTAVNASESLRAVPSSLTT